MTENNYTKPNRLAIGDSLSPYRSGDLPSAAQSVTNIHHSRSTTNMLAKSLVSNAIITETRRSRKVALSNIRLLSNRVNMLEQEEYKLKKETKEMEIKAKQLYEQKIAENKRRMDAAIKLKMHQDEKIQQINQLKEKISESKVKHYQNLYKMNEMIQIQKKKDYLELKEQKERNEELIRSAYISNLITKRNQLEKVKKELELGEIRKREYLNFRQELIQEDRERSFIEEEEKIKLELKDLGKLSKKEDLLLGNLEYVNERHLNASAEFLSVKNATLDQVSQRSTRFDPLSVRHSRNRKHNASDLSGKIAISDNLAMVDEPRQYGL